jgi:hypothetical protein
MSKKFKGPRNIAFYELRDWLFVVSFIPWFIPLLLALLDVIPFSGAVIVVCFAGLFANFFAFGIEFMDKTLLKEATLQKICNDPLVDIDVKVAITNKLSYRPYSITRTELAWIAFDAGQSKKHQHQFDARSS